MNGAPQRGFDEAEFRQRLSRAQKMMAKAGLACLLLSTEPEVRYFTGYLTRFWESPARPWFLIVPAVGDPIAVIPSIGVALMSRSWIADIRSWRSPDLVDDGVSLLRDTLRDVAGTDGQIGVPSGLETHVRMPMHTWNALQDGLTIVDDAEIMLRLRRVKSQNEIAKITQAGAIATRAFARVPEIAQAGVPLEKVFRHFQMLLLEEGADWVPYLAGAAGQDGYFDVISPATETPLMNGDILMLDTGAVWDGYFCDFDRNFAVGAGSDVAQSAHARLIDAVNAGFEAAKPGALMCDLFDVMSAVVAGESDAVADAGRMGHGLGMQLTEWPSIIPTERTVLEAGMVLTLEPSVETVDGRIMVHEENIAITETGAVFLNTPAGRALGIV
ncbi:Xaa-Pro peptidase family protein [Ascidiaceihabitans sp.]|nr:Xaa-Pro peptidase family protein [Ascidiaceihabitans sp.]MDB9946021.1 Xaa-Pro peptidase family protein [Ascidiaceihabitans sp.]